MIINYDSPGQLCNRIWSLLPSIAYGLEYKKKVLIINFEEYSGCFENLNKNKLISFASYKLLKRFFLSLKARGYIRNGQPNIFSKLFGLNLIEGWSNRLGNVEMIEKQSEEIRDIFRFKKEVADAVDSFFSLSQDVITIGIHIRRGDYKDWLNGVFYYNDEVYLQIIKDLEAQLRLEGKKVKFLLCSNEKIDMSCFGEFDCFVIPQSSGIKDLCALSKCDFIVGPPSSYSQWASFYGKVPLRFLMACDQELKLKDFSVITALSKFENGEILNID